MKRVLRSATPKIDVENEPQMQSLRNIPVNPQKRRRAAAILKENKENVTKQSKSNKTGRRNDVQPLQQKNSSVISKKHDETAKQEKLPPENISTNVSKKKNRTKSVDDVKRNEESIVNTHEQESREDKQKQPTRTATKKPIFVSSVTTRRKQSKDIPPVESVAKNARSEDKMAKSPIVVLERLALASPVKRTLRQRGTQKVSAKSTPMKNPEVLSTVKTRSGTKSAAVVSPKRRTRRQLNKESPPAMKTSTRNAVKKKEAMKNNNVATSHASHVTFRRNKEKTSPEQVPNMKPTTSTAGGDQFVTTRRNRNFETAKSTAATNDKPKTKEPVVRNVTTRRRTTKASNSLNEIKTAIDMPRSRRSQSVHRTVKETAMDFRSNEERSVDVDAIATPFKRKKHEQKVAKQQELSVNNRSDSSDQSNGSTVPIYKRDSNSNNNTVNSVFEFESNSQENTPNNDEQMQELLAKLVRENKASVAKRKGRGKKGVTKAKIHVTRAEQIEKIRADMKKLRELKLLNSNAIAPKVKPATSISKSQATTSHADTHFNKKPSNASVIDQVDPVDEVNVDPSPCTPRNNQFQPEIAENMDSVEIDVGHVQENENIQKPLEPIKFSNAYGSNATPLHQVHATYASPKKGTTVHQSTPVRIVPSPNASPWRYNVAKMILSGNVFSRYSGLEKSPIKGGDITKAAATNTRSPKKKPLATKQLSNQLPQVEKPKTLTNDLANGFGFFDDSDDDNGVDDYAQRPSLPAVNCSFGSSKQFSPKKSSTHGISQRKPATIVTLPKKSAVSAISPKNLPKKPTTPSMMNLFKIPQVLNSVREKVQALKNSQKPTVSYDILDEPKTKTQSKISTHFGDHKPKPSSTIPSSSKYSVNKKTAVTTRTKEISETEKSTSYIDHDGVSLFETTWPVREDQTHRSYSRVTKRDHKRQQEYTNFMTDDESEFGDTVSVPKRGKRTKQKDDKYEEQLKQFEEQFNSECMDVDNFEMIMETSKVSSN